MAESSACLIRSFSQPSRDYHHEDPLRALTTSISLGRFMTETLDWEKRSAFTQNRNLEEAKNVSKLGTVAQKKAYFEAHYKRIAAKKKAAALLEQELQAPNHSPSPEQSNDSSLDSKQNSPAAIDDMQDQQSARTDLLPAITANEDNPNAEVNESDYNGNPIQVELLNQTENTKIPEEKKTPIKVVSKKEDLASSSKKKSVISSSKSSIVKPTNVYSKKDDDNARDLLEKKKKKKKSTPKSLHMSMNLGSRAAGEAIKSSSPILNKIASSRIVKNLVKASKDSWAQRTPTRASVSGVPKLKAQPENRRTETLLHPMPSRTKAAEGKPPSISKDSRSESSRSVCATKTRSPTVSSSFSFKSEERAAKRKEFFRKIEENAKEAEKARILTKSKIPTRPCSPKLGRKVTLQETSSRPPWKSSVKNDCSKNVIEKNRCTRSVNNTLHKKNTRENASPNIPL